MVDCGVNMDKVIEEDLQFITNQKLPWSEFEGCTVLVSGASGFLPSYMVETLLYLNDHCEKNIKVIAIVRNEQKASEKFQHHGNRSDLEFIIQDISSPIEISEPIDYIIHAASQASPRYYSIDPVGTLSANILGTINLLKISQKNNIKGFLFFSTGGVLGRIEPSSIPAKEDDYGYIDPTDVMSCYNQSKKMAETICVSWYKQYNIPVKMVRPSYVYGPGIQLGDGRAFSNFISNITKNNPIRVIDGDRKTRSFCYIADATSAFFAVLLKGQDGEPYNVGVEEETSIKELALEMVKVAAKDYDNEISYENSFDNQRGSVDRSCFDITKIKSLGWQPKYSLSAGLKRVINHYRGEK